MRATSSTSAITSSGSPTSGDGPATPGGLLLDDPVTVLPGAGPRTAARLAAHGLLTVRDLLGHLPRAYDDLRRVTELGDLASVRPGRVVLVRGTIKRIRIFPRRLLDLYLGPVGAPDGATVRARWFRPPPGMQRSFAKGDVVALAGPLRRIEPGEGGRDSDGAGQLELVHPSNVTAALATAADGLGIRARYPLVAGVPGKVLEKIIAAAVDHHRRHAERIGDPVDEETRTRLGLPTAAGGLRALHRPAASVTDEELEALAAGRSAAHRRLALEELLVVQTGLARQRLGARAQPAMACAADLHAVMAGVRAALPFTPTGAQEQAIAEIARDMAEARPMQRLLVGDVGSGKTAVAFAAAALAAASGGQALLMVPTETLADQHARTLTALAARLPVGSLTRVLTVARLTGATPRAEREAILDACRDGRVGLLVGTQALLEARAALPRLALAIVDEQHRFGVAQRARLRRAPSGDGAGAGDSASGTAGMAALPHLLVMSATPIPRTLALTLYGDLDVTVLGQLPPGRRPPVTEIARGEEERQAAYRRLRASLAEGRQAFVVCPVRERAARPGAVTATARYAELRRALAKDGFRVGLLHGDLDAASKESVLRAFAAGAIDLLVATTVVELGIDVPNATVMLVEDAERFGLAQLHQLRGRVGRGAFPGTCFLCTRGGGTDTDADADADGRSDTDGDLRLAQLAATGDGFRIAEADLAQRGEGDLFGVRQAGAPALRFLRLMGRGGDLAGYLQLVETARAEAQRIAAADPELARPEHRALGAAVAARWAAGAVHAEEAG